MKQLRTIKNILRLCAWSSVLALGLAAQADTLYQTVDMGNSGIYWLDTYWTNSTMTVATNPAPGNDYINDIIGGSPDTRTLPAGSVFPGDSLTMRNDGRLQLKNGTSPTSVNLILEDGTFIVNGGGGTAVLDGTLTGFGDVGLDSGAESRTIQLGSLIKSDNTFSSIEIYGGGTVIITNSANTFTGVWDVASGTLKGVGLGLPAAINVGGTGVLDFDADYTMSDTAINMGSAAGAVLLLDQDVTVKSLTYWADISTLNEVLPADVYTGAELLALNPIAFAGSDSNSMLTVLTGESTGGGDDGITVYQTSNMDVDIDWNDPTFWDNGEAPASTNDYVNDNGGVTTNVWVTRTPTSGSESFAGKSLTLTNNAALTIKGNGPWTINTFNVSAGSTIGNGGANAAIIAGTLNLTGSGSVYLDSQTVSRETTISSVISADPTITNIVIAVGQVDITNTVNQASGGSFTIEGFPGYPNTFDGTWVVNAGTLKGADFASGSFLVTDTGLLDFDYSYVNTLADITVETNPTNAAMNGMLLLDQNIQVGSATLAGASLPDGAYTGADLKAHPTYGAVIDPSSSDVAILAIGESVALPVYQTANAKPWTDATVWDNGEAPSSLYDYVNPGYEFRNPTSGDQTFPGKSLTMDSGSTLKLQGSQNVTITDFTVYAQSTFKTVGNTSLNGDLAILGSGSIIWDVEAIRTMTVNSKMTVGPDVTNFTIRATQTELAGTAGGIIASDPDNTFTGEWVIEEGFLKGPGVGQSSFHVWESGYLDIGAAYSNEAANLTIDVNPTNSAVGGQILLSHDMTVNKATLWGVELEAGTYDINELGNHPVYGGAFAGGSSGSLTVTFVPDVPEIGDLTYEVSATEVVVGWAEGSKYATYTLQSDNDLVNAPSWTDLVTVPGIDGPMSITNAISSDPKQFYRVIGN